MCGGGRMGGRRAGIGRRGCEVRWCVRAAEVWRVVAGLVATLAGTFSMMMNWPATSSVYVTFLSTIVSFQIPHAPCESSVRTSLLRPFGICWKTPFPSDGLELSGPASQHAKTKRAEAGSAPESCYAPARPRSFSLIGMKRSRTKASSGAAGSWAFSKA